MAVMSDPYLLPPHGIGNDIAILRGDGDEEVGYRYCRYWLRRELA